MNRRFKLFKVVKIVLMVTLFIIIVGWGTMYLWNWLVPLLFHGPAITFLQALGLLLLSKILFGGFSRGRRFNGRNRWKQRYAAMTSEEREEFYQKMQERCGGKFRDFEHVNPVTE